MQITTYEIKMMIYSKSLRALVESNRVRLQHNTDDGGSISSLLSDLLMDICVVLQLMTGQANLPTPVPFVNINSGTNVVSQLS